uniref:zinc finger protein 569-like n=1 Tax=Erigeron canadensis TaxID=72917 RepID=UPI001CB944E8|nr:zinc finger protein 569-like [Erigeron canadensis]
MKKDQEKEKWHVCKFCDQSFPNGKKLGGHMRGHLGLIAASREKSVQESINGGMGIDLFDNGSQLIKKSQSFDQDCGRRKKGVQENDQDDDGMVNKSQQEMDVDQDYGTNANNNVYVLRENPKRSWRVSNNSISKSSLDDEYDVFCKQCGKGFQSSRALGAHMRYHSTKESISTSIVCEKCDKVFDSRQALYGHMRSHSMKKLDDESSTLSSMRKKRSYIRYNNSDHISTTTSSSSSPCDGYDDDDFDVELKGAICLMMLSRGVRNIEGVKLVISNQAGFAFSDYGGYSARNADSEVSVDGSMDFCKLKNKSKMGLDNDLIFANGPGQIDTGRVGSMYRSIKKPKSCEVKKRSKDHICSICFREFRCSQALGSHKRTHLKTESKVMERDHKVELDTPELGFDGGIGYGDVEFKLRWVQTKIEWDPLSIGN